MVIVKGFLYGIVSVGSLPSEGNKKYFQEKLSLTAELRFDDVRVVRFRS